MISERLQELLDKYQSVPLKDGAGIVTPAGNDTASEAKGIALCLRIALEEERKK